MPGERKGRAPRYVWVRFRHYTDAPPQAMFASNTSSGKFVAESMTEHRYRLDPPANPRRKRGKRQ